MAPRTLLPNASLESVWTEMAYTRSRLMADPNATDFAPAVEGLLVDIEETRSGQLRAALGVTTAQALCDHLSDELGALVVDLAGTLVYVVGDRKDSRVTLYLRKPPHVIARLALPAKLKIVGGWPELLSRDPEELVSRFAPKLADLLERAKAAHLAQGRAENGRADFRLRQIAPLIARVNDERYRLYGLLGQRASERKLGKRWPDGFFRVRPKRKASRDEPDGE